MATQAIKIFKNGDTDKRVGINLDSDVNPAAALDVMGYLHLTTNSGRYIGNVFYKKNTSGKNIVGEWWLDTGTGSNYDVGRYGIRVYSPTNPVSTVTTGSHETYYLPQVTAGLAENKTYYFLTTKTAVTVAQGGTGATTAADARTNLAITPANIGAAASSHNHSGANITSGTVDAARLPNASTTAAGIVSTGFQHFSGTKEFNYISTYGIANDGSASMYSTYIRGYNSAGNLSNIIFYNAGSADKISGGHFVFAQYSPKTTADAESTGYCEYYRLPEVNTGKTANTTYYIITSKGATMSGVLKFTGIPVIQNNSQYPVLRFKPNHSTNDGSDVYGPASIFINAGSTSEITNNKMIFRQYSPSASSGSTTYTGYYEQYYFPDINIGRTSNGGYTILTTKSAVTIAQGGTGATDRLTALKNLTNEAVGADAQYFLTITQNWTKGGYTTVASAKTVLGLGSAAYLNYSGTIYGSGQMGWKKVSITLTNGAGSVACTGVTADSVVHATRVGTYSETSGGYSTSIGAAATNAGNVKVFSMASSTVTWSTYLWWSKTATGG